MERAIALIMGVCALMGVPQSVTGHPLERHFELEVRTAPASTAPKTMAIDIVVTYNGSDVVEVTDLKGKFVDLELSTPDGWVPRARPGLRVISGQIPNVTLVTGQSISTLIDLREFFSKVAPGKAKLVVLLNVWPERGRAKTPVVLRSAITLDVLPETAQAMNSL
jgi:hypothetical protein